MTQTTTTTPSPGASPSPQGSTRLAIIAAAAGLAAVVLVNIYIEMARSQAVGGSFIVYRTQREIEPGEDLDDRYLEEVIMPDRFADTFTEAIKQAGTGRPERLGETVRQTIPMNDYVRYEHFTDVERDKLIERIPTGKRLIALPVDSDTLPSIRPGSQVDIFGRFPSTGGGSGGVNSMAVMENVQVFAVGERTVIEEEEGNQRRARMGNIRKIEIVVEPRQIPLLMEIKNRTLGPFELALRKAGDNTAEMLDATGTINDEVLARIGYQRTF